MQRLAFVSAPRSAPGRRRTPPKEIGRIAALPMEALLAQSVVPGLLPGVVVVLAFTAAVRWLGASRAGAFPALVPLTATLIGIPVAGEWPGLLGCRSVKPLMASTNAQAPKWHTLYRSTLNKKMCGRWNVVEIRKMLSHHKIVRGNHKCCARIEEGITTINILRQ
jgi:hypothetical protein